RDVRQAAAKRIGQNSAAASFGNYSCDQLIARRIEVVDGHTGKALLERREDHVDGILRKRCVEIQLATFFFGFLVEFVEGFRLGLSSGSVVLHSRNSDKQQQSKNS